MHRLVEERQARVVLKRIVVRARHASDEPVRINRRRTIKREYLAGFWNEGNRRPGKCVPEECVDVLLQIEIDVRVKRIAFRRSDVFARTPAGWKLYEIPIFEVR